MSHEMYFLRSHNTKLVILFGKKKKKNEQIKDHLIDRQNDVPLMLQLQAFTHIRKQSF